MLFRYLKVKLILNYVLRNSTYRSRITTFLILKSVLRPAYHSASIEADPQIFPAFEVDAL